MYVGSKQVVGERMAPFNRKGGNLCIEAEDVGGVLNEYFTSVFAKGKDMDDGEIREHIDILVHLDIKKEMLNVLTNTKVDQFLGLDWIYPMILK